MCAGSIIFANTVNYWLMIPLIPIVIFCVYIRCYFLKSFREVKRVEALCRSPVYVHATNTNTGIITIRACKNEHIMLNEFETLSDNHTKAFFAFISLTRWYAVRLALIVVFYTIIIMFTCILSKGIYIG
jgi:ATP-binding cassette subfamily C (CFTR/MRP) protein 4